MRNGVFANMKKKTFPGFLLALVLFILPVFVSASLEITEIMYDAPGTDTDHEWVEIYNSGSSAVTILTGSGSGTWRFSDKSPHILNFSSGNLSLPAGAYAIIAKSESAFRSDFPSFSGVILASSISLPNTSATLSLIDENGNTVSSVSYASDDGAVGDGNSLQLSEQGFIAALPTPGEDNESSPASPADPNNEESDTANKSSSNSTSSGSGGSSKKVIKDLKVDVGNDILTTVGSPVEFFAEVPEDIKYHVNFKWSLGDGSYHRGQRVVYNYSYPGEYIAVVNAHSNFGDTTGRVNVRVTAPEIMVNKLPDGAIEVENKSKDEIDMHLWKIASGDKHFIFPRDTIVKAGGKITLSPQVSGLNIYPLSIMQVYDPRGVEYKQNSAPVRSAAPKKITTAVKTTKPALTKPAVKPAEQEELQNSIVMAEVVKESGGFDQSASVGAVFEVEKDSGFWRDVLSFFGKLF